MRSEKYSTVLPVDGQEISVKKFVVWGNTFFHVELPGEKTETVLGQRQNLESKSWSTLTPNAHPHFKNMGSHLDALCTEDN